MQDENIVVVHRVYYKESFWTTHLIGRLTVLQVTSHSEIDSSPLAGRRRAEQATANVSCSKTFFLSNCVYTNNVLSTGVHV